MLSAPVYIRPIQSQETGKLAIIAAGGTGGHVFPAEAFARELAARGWRVRLATDRRGEKYAQAFPASMRLLLPVESRSRSGPIRMLLQLIRSTAIMMKSFAEDPPALVAGFGGYASAPVLLAARLRRRPFLLHEQNAVLGRVNRLFAARAEYICCGFDRLDLVPPRLAGRIRIVGNPVRPDIAVLHDLPFPSDKEQCEILVIGGSQGAAALGEAIPAAIGLLPEQMRRKLHVCQQARPENIEAVRAGFADIGIEADLASFFDDMASQMQKAHLIISRAGASSVSEVAISGRPSILVPLPTATDDHQLANAEMLASAGAARIVEQDAELVPNLAKAMQDWLDNSDKLAMASRAARSCARINAAGILADIAENMTQTATDGGS